MTASRVPDGDGTATIAFDRMLKQVISSLQALASPETIERDWSLEIDDVVDVAA